MKKNPKLEYIDYQPMEELLVVHRNHPMADRGKPCYQGELPRIGLKELENETFVLLRKATVMRDILDIYCDEHDIRLKAAVEVYDSGFARAAVKAGLGIGIYVAETLNLPEDNDLRYFALDPPLYYHSALYFKKSIYQSTLFKDYLQEIRKTLKQKKV